MKITIAELLCSVGTRQRLKRILLFTMRASLFYILIVIGSMQLLLAAHEGKGQNIETTYVTIGLQNEDLVVLFERIKNSTGLGFTFNQDEVQGYTNLNLPKAKRSVKEILDTVLGKTSLTYQQLNGNMILVFGKVGRTENGQLNSGIAETPNAFAVQGTVTDASNQLPLAGVNVIVKGTAKGTTTDAGGKFAIDVEDNDVLVFTFIGFKSFETSVSGRSVINVILEEDATSLQEVVVNAGYWQVKDREQTGNISRVTAEDIQKQPVSNPLQALIGRMPGVYIQQNSGVPGGSFNIQIRGRNSIRDDGNSPLYIIDGVPFPSTPLGSDYSGPITMKGNPLSNLNPADIESIEVLKDADATSIYGSRGANGVVLITTKKGKAGKTEVDVNVYQGIGRVSRKMNMLSTKQYLEMRHEAFTNDGVAPGSINPDYDLLNWDTTRYTDWQKELIGGTAHVTNAQTSISGGNMNTQFSIGGGYYRETTVFPGDFSDQKYSTRFNINHTSDNHKFRAALSGSFLVDNNNLLSGDLTSKALSLPPIAPAVYDSEGNLNWENNTWDNPFARLQRKFKSRTSTLVGNGVMTYEILKGLQLKTNLGYTEIRLNENINTPITSLNPADGITTGYSSFANNNIQTWIIEPQINYQAKSGLNKLSAYSPGVPPKV